MKNKIILLPLLGICFSLSCNRPAKVPESEALVNDVVNETVRTWEAYRTYAWGDDNLLPVSGGSSNWYGESLAISPIDTYSTLKIMGLESYAREIEAYVLDSLDFNKDIFAKTFEMNIRVLGGLLSMYDLSGNQGVLDKAEDLAIRIMPAFDSETGIPHYWVNLKTGEACGDTVNVAQGGSYLLEMGILSYYTGNPDYYQTAKKASMAIYNARSQLGLVSQSIDNESGQWTDNRGHIGCYIDSYYESLYKGWILFRDPSLREMWDSSIGPVHQYIAEESDTSLWYGSVDIFSGEKTGSQVTLYDAYFPGLLALSGDLQRAGKLQISWNTLWNKHGIEPHIYDYHTGELKDPTYYLNPEIIESAWYLFKLSGEKTYLEMIKQYYHDIKSYCRTDIAYAHLSNVVTKKKIDAMSTFFLAETMKYFYLAFSKDSGIDPDTHVFNTEAHPFRKSNFLDEKLEAGLGIEVVQIERGI